jgi:hypothetical protein
LEPFTGFQFLEQQIFISGICVLAMTALRTNKAFSALPAKSSPPSLSHRSTSSRRSMSLQRCGPDGSRGQQQGGKQTDLNSATFLDGST